jgi:N-acyl homoserine lactone hydrolase
MRNFFICFCLFALCAAGAARAEINKSPQLKMYIFDCGTIEVSDMNVFSSSGDYANLKELLSNSCFLIRHEKGDLLWDAGLPARNANAEPVVNGIFTQTLSQTLPEQLEEIGVKPEDVEFLAISHSHFDHVGQVSAFKSATWLVNKREVTAMFFTKESQNTYADFKDMKRRTFDDDFDVFGEGSVIILDMPGHTEGHTALQLMFPKTGPVLLSGL